MNFVAIRMLIGDRAKYLGIIMGITFASLLITQQAAIFTGLMTRTFGAISDLGIAEIWIVDPKVQFIDDIKPMADTQLLRVRGVDGVDWALPLYKGLLKARLADGNFQTVNVIGLDDSTLAGGPPEMLEGSIADLRRADGVIVDVYGATDKLAKPPLVPGGPRIPLAVGDTLEINDHRAIVVGISRNTRTFQSQPVVYMPYQRAVGYAPPERRRLSAIIARPEDGEDIHAVCDRIERLTGLAAYTADEFKELTYGYFLKYTGIPINFGIAIVLGFVVGTAVAGQTFYNFTLDNIRQFGALKAMGVRNATLLRMILLQAVLVGFIGYGLGVGAASLIGYVSQGSELAFRMPWQLLVLSAVAVSLICVLAALLSILKVIRLEPAIVFKG
jgi:putative ABC transport system permease protein